MTPRRWALFVLAILGFIIVVYVLMNRYTPRTDVAYVQAFVVQVAPGVSGNVIKVYPKENAPVKVGEVLFEIDPLPYETALKQAEVKLVLSRIEVAQEQEAVQSTKALVDNAQADLKSAQAMYNAIDSLRNTGSVARMDFVTASDRLSARRDALHEAQSSQRRAELQFGALLDDEHAAVRAAESEVAMARYQLDQTILKAPADGYITNIQLQVGAYVGAGDKVMTFVDGSSWWIAADFWESSLQRMESGNGVELSLQTIPGSTWRGRVESIGGGGDARTRHALGGTALSRRLSGPGTPDPAHARENHL
jgi:multidrug resistance efflux pump